MIALRNIAVKEGYIPPFFRGQVKIISTFGRLNIIEDFDNKKREKLGLPPVKKNFEEVKKLLKNRLIKEKI